MDERVDVHEEAANVLCRLAKLAVDYGVEVDGIDVASHDAADLLCRLRLACAGRALEQELVHASVVSDCIDDAGHVVGYALREGQRVCGKVQLAKELRATVARLRNERISVRHERHNVFGQLVVSSSVEITGDVVCLVAERRIVVLGVIANQVDDAALFHGCPILLYSKGHYRTRYK